MFLYKDESQKSIQLRAEDEQKIKTIWQNKDWASNVGGFMFYHHAAWKNSIEGNMGIILDVPNEEIKIILMGFTIIDGDIEKLFMDDDYNSTVLMSIVEQINNEPEKERVSLPITSTETLQDVFEEWQKQYPGQVLTADFIKTESQQNTKQPELDIKMYAKDPEVPNRQLNLLSRESCDQMSAKEVYKYFFAASLPPEENLRKPYVQGLKEALVTDKKDSKAMAMHYSNLSDMFVKWDEYQNINAAIYAMNLAVQHDSPNEEYYEKLCELYMKKDSPKKESELLKLIPCSLYDLAVIGSKRNSHAILQLLTDCIKKFNTPLFYILRSEIYVRSKKFISAANEIKNVLPIIKNCDAIKRSYFKLAYGLSMNGDHYLLPLVKQLIRLEQLTSRKEIDASHESSIAETKNNIDELLVDLGSDERLEDTNLALDHSHKRVKL